MAGERRKKLEGWVWGDDEEVERLGSSDGGEGKEVILKEGDGVFIPAGWWHAVRGVGEGVNASVRMERGV